MMRRITSLLLICPGIAGIGSPCRADILYESDHGAIGKVTSGGVSSVFATSVGPGTNLTGLAFDRAGNLYVANYADSTIEKFTPGGVGSVFASTGLSLPHGLAFDSAGNLYAANQGDNTIEVFTPGGVGSVFASTGPAAPTGLAFDIAGNLYASILNNTIQKFTPDGIGTVFATTEYNPSGLAFDSAGDLYVASSSPSFNLILKISPGGVVSTFAAGVPSEGLAFDSAGSLYASDFLDGTIIKYPPTGGGVGPVYARNGVLNFPTDLAFTNDAGVPLPLANQVPEPASTCTTLLGALLLQRRRRHQAVPARRRKSDATMKQAIVCFPASLIAVMVLLAPALARGGPVPVYGGPAWNQDTRTGYDSPDLPVAPGATAGNGVAVGGGFKYVGGQGYGTRAVRWDASGSPATELGNLGTNSNGATLSGAYAMNAAGTVVGYANKFTADGVNLDRRAVRWDASGTAATELGILGTDSSGVSNSTAFAINAGGTAVGVAYKYTGTTLRGTRAVRWDASGTAATELGILATDSFGSSFAAAFAVNNSGTAVGFAHDNHDRPVRWDASGTIATELNALDAGTGNAQGEALAINDSGTAVGYSYKYTGRPFESDLGTRAVRWDAGGTAATELDNLGTDSTGHTFSKAYAVNIAGTAVGVAGKYTDGTFLLTRAVRWGAGGSAVTELGNLGTDANGITNTVANAINAAGITVGEADEYAGGTFVGRRAVVWGPDGVAIDLNTLIDPSQGWTLSEARGISDGNWVSGIGLFDPDGTGALPAYSRAFLLDVSTVVPEPTSSLTVFLGASLLRRRRR